jgi:hypothetical protein
MEVSGQFYYLGNGPKHTQDKTMGRNKNHSECGDEEKNFYGMKANNFGLYSLFPQLH